MRRYLKEQRNKNASEILDRLYNGGGQNNCSLKYVNL